MAIVTHETALSLLRAVKASLSDLEEELDKNFSLLLECRILSTVVERSLRSGQDETVPTVVVSNADDSEPSAPANEDLATSENTSQPSNEVSGDQGVQASSSECPQDPPFVSETLQKLDGEDINTQPGDDVSQKLDGKGMNAQAQPDDGGPNLDVGPSNHDEPGTKEFYVITVGRNPGVFCGRQGIQANTVGVSGSFVDKFDTEEEAIAAYRKALLNGDVVRVTSVIHREILRAPNGEA